MSGQELNGLRGPSVRGMDMTGRRAGLDELGRAVVVAVAFGLLMALWVMLWIPTAPVP